MNPGSFGADVASFELHLAAENKAAATIRIYTEAPRWFASAYLLAETDKTRWEQVDTQDVQRWVVWLLRHYTESYAYQQYRSLQQFFRWLAVEDEIADPMARLRAPKVSDKPVPFFSSVELSKLDEACRGSAFAQRRDAAILAVFRSTGIRLTEMAGIRHHPDDLDHGDVDLGRREIYVRGKGGKDRIVRIDRETARRIDRYLRARVEAPAGVPRAVVARRRRPRAADPRRDLPDDQAARSAGRRAGLPAPVPAPFQPHLAGTRRRRGRPDGAERLVLPADAEAVRGQRPRCPRPPQLRPRDGATVPDPTARPLAHGPGAVPPDADVCF